MRVVVVCRPKSEVRSSARVQDPAPSRAAKLSTTTRGSTGRASPAGGTRAPRAPLSPILSGPQPSAGGAGPLGLAAGLAPKRARLRRVDALVSVIPADAEAGRPFGDEHLLDDAEARRPFRGFGFSDHPISGLEVHFSPPRSLQARAYSSSEPRPSALGVGLVPLPSHA